MATTALHRGGNEHEFKVGFVDAPEDVMPDMAARVSFLQKALDAQAIGMGLTESLAMTPAASVSGFYLAHPQAAYFNVGRIGEDQLEDWAAREGMEATLARRLLAPVLG